MSKWSCFEANKWDNLQAQYDTWLEVWKAVATAQAQFGHIDKGVALSIQNATISVQRVAEIEAETHHDLNSALTAAQESISPEAASRIHWGLTSSDVVDTALHLRLTRMTDHWEELALNRPTYPWPQIVAMLQRIRKEVCVGKLAGPAGTHATIPHRIEERAMEMLGLDTDAIPTQVISRDRIAAWVIGVVGISMAHGGREMGSIIIALENVALWHERDMSHSSNERVYLPQLIHNVDRLLHGAAHQIGKETTGA